MIQYCGVHPWLETSWNIVYLFPLYISALPLPLRTLNETCTSFTFLPLISRLSSTGDLSLGLRLGESCILETSMIDRCPRHYNMKLRVPNLPAGLESREGS